MSIKFTQYMMPDGRKVETWIERPKEIELLAEQFIRSGGWFECEMLSDYKTVSLTACFKLEDGPDDVFIEVVKNGPEVTKAVDKLVRAAARWTASRSESGMEGER